VPRYEYSAIDDYGRKAKGFLMAPDEGGLRATLASMGLHLLSGKERSQARAGSLVGRGVHRSDVIQFSFHLRTLLAAGISIVVALDDLAEQTDNPAFQEVIRDIRRNVQAGSTLSDSFALHAAIFPESYVSIVRAGETTGNLDGVLADLTKFLTWQEELSKTIKQATYYPLTVLTAVGGLIFLLFTFVFPRFVKVFQASAVELPLPTKIVIAISIFFRDYGLFLLGGIGLLFLAFHFYRRTERGRLRVDGWKLRIPLVGGLVRAIEVSRFSHYLALLFRAGVETIHSLVVVEQVLGNKVLAGVIRTAREQLTSGGQLSSALAASGEFPPLVVRMVAAGEATGKLDETLENVSAFYDREVPLVVRKTFAVLEPLIIVVLSVVVLGAALSFFLALYKMVGAMGGSP
jgi:type IV pilus assembly protein PilC